MSPPCSLHCVAFSWDFWSHRSGLTQLRKALALGRGKGLYQKVIFPLDAGVWSISIPQRDSYSNGSLRNVVEKHSPRWKWVMSLTIWAIPGKTLAYSSLAIWLCACYTWENGKKPPAHSGRRGMTSLHLVLESLEGCGTWERGGQEGLQSWDGLNSFPVGIPSCDRWVMPWWTFTINGQISRI